MGYETVIGLEVHVQLNTATKAFCGCSTEFGAGANTQVCSICMGLPGCLPVLNEKAFEYALRVAMALNCRIAEITKFDRKNYFYPDLPKNYQISQYDLPLAEDGFLKFKSSGNIKRAGIKRVHLEEDAGKLIHEQDVSLVDFNRTGIPLLEIVGCPDIHSPQEAYDYLLNLKQIVRYLGVSSCDMEKGILRCDANISVKRETDSKLGTKIELKNMNSFHGVRDALSYEVKRQIKLLEDGGDIVQETRLWDEQKNITNSMRTKEGAQDYRYFPEPDLPPFIISRQLLEEIKGSLPELAQAKQIRFISEYKLSEYDASVLTSDKEIADFFEECAKDYSEIKSEAKPVANWILGPLLSELNSRGLDMSQLTLADDAVEATAKLVKMVKAGDISNLAAKSVFSEMIESGRRPEVIIKEKNLTQISDTDTLDKIIAEIIKANKKSVDDYLDGKQNAIMFLVGQVMRKSKGKANPKAVLELLKNKLTSPARGGTS